MNPGEGPGRERLFSVFRDLVAIDSESGAEAGVRDYLDNVFTSLGLECEEDDAGLKTGGQSGNLFVSVPGRRPELEPLVLNAHMDTVKPGAGVLLVETGDRFESSGDTVLGADCKAGVAAIIAAVESTLSNGPPARPLQLVFTVQEEPGLVGSRNMDPERLKGRWGVVLDGSGPVGGIVTEAPGQFQLRFTVRGRSAHAGVEPELGSNAIACAAKAIASLSLGRLDARTTANIGLISGGTAANVVPDLTVVVGEVRGMSEATLEREKSRMTDAFRLAASRDGCALDVEADRSFEHFKLEHGSGSVRLLAEALRSTGIEPSYGASGGGSDANVFNAAGLKMAVMRIGLANAHSAEEHILKDDLHAVSRVVFEMIRLSEKMGEER